MPSIFTGTAGDGTLAAFAAAGAGALAFPLAAGEGAMLGGLLGALLGAGAGAGRGGNFAGAFPGTVHDAWRHCLRLNALNKQSKRRCFCMESAKCCGERVLLIPA